MAEKKETKKPTEYVVLRSEGPAGPFDVVGNFTNHGQIAAKKAAAASLYGEHEGVDPEQYFFTAVPASSWVPQKPVIQMTISFLTEDGGVQPDEDEDPEADEPEDGDGDQQYEPLVPAKTDPDPEPELEPAGDDAGEFDAGLDD